MSLCRLYHEQLHYYVHSNSNSISFPLLLQDRQPEPADTLPPRRPLPPPTDTTVTDGGSVVVIPGTGGVAVTTTVAPTSPPSVGSSVITETITETTTTTATSPPRNTAFESCIVRIESDAQNPAVAGVHDICNICGSTNLVVAPSVAQVATYVYDGFDFSCGCSEVSGQKGMIPSDICTAVQAAVAAAGTCQCQPSSTSTPPPPLGKGKKSGKKAGKRLADGIGGGGATRSQRITGIAGGSFLTDVGGDTGYRRMRNRRQRRT